MLSIKLIVIGIFLVGIAASNVEVIDDSINPSLGIFLIALG